MHPYAQTNIQLLNQLHRLGYGAADLRTLVATYELTMELMTGRFRASGKTFIAHLVGTASILGSLRVPAPVVAAGLLHAAYSAGDFGDERAGISDAKRKRVQSVVGDEVEGYICRYHNLRWSEQTVRSIVDGFDGMTSIERNVVLMRLANELEELLDLGILYCGQQKRLAITGGQRFVLMVGLARKLGFPGLAEELARAMSDTATSVLPADMLGPIARNSSFSLAPQSCKRLRDLLASRLASLQATAPGQATEP